MMKKKNFIFSLILFSLIINISSPLFAQDKNSKIIDEEEKETPQYLQDLRRFEIISLGSLPFVMLDSTLVYSGVKYIQNDFSSQYLPGFSQTYTQKEQLGLLFTSIGISIGIGVTDFIINLVTRNKKNKSRQEFDNPIIIIPISQDSEAVKIDNSNVVSQTAEQSSIDEQSTTEKTTEEQTSEETIPAEQKEIN